MTNDALPRRSHTLIRSYLDQCQNLGLALDKYAPWQLDGRGTWNLSMDKEVRRHGQTSIQAVTGGEAKGLWLSTNRRSKKGESPSLMEVERTDAALMRAYQERWLSQVQDARGLGFEMETSERLVVGLGASHVLETAITLHRNSGLPYLPGSSVKGLARTWALFEVAAALGVSIETPASNLSLNKLDNALMAKEGFFKWADEEAKLSLSDDDKNLIEWFQFVFGTQGLRGGVTFLDATYGGQDVPIYAADVMTPHYVDYYTTGGTKAPSDDGNPQPVAFLTLEAKQVFLFGLLPNNERAREHKAHEIAADWLRKALSSLGAGSKTAAGYGYFRGKSFNILVR